MSEPTTEYEFVATTAAQVVASPHEHPGFLVKGLMPATGIHVLYGPPGVGKSFLALDVALHVAAGRDWGGRRVDARGSCVVYVASEGSLAFKTRIACALRERGIPATIPFLLVTKAPNLGYAQKRDSDAFVENVKDQCAKLGLKPRLIVLDTLARSIIGMDESSAKDMGVFVENVAKLSAAFASALVMPVHHTGKDQDRGMRGSSALQGAADAIWQVRQEEEGLSFSVEKMKDGRSGFRIGFALRAVECGKDRDGEAVTTQVVAFPERPVETADKTPRVGEKSPTWASVLRVIERTLADEGVTSAPDRPPEAQGRKALAVEVLSGKVIDALMAGGRYPKRDSARSVFHAQRKRLVEMGRIAEHGGWVWKADAPGQPFDEPPF